MNAHTVPRRQAAAAAVAVAALIVPALGAQGPCRSEILAASLGLDERTRYKERGGICEGRYEEEVDARALSIVSLTLSHPEGKASVDDALTIRAGGEELERIEATSLVDRTYYRMDALWPAPPEEVFEWPLRMVSRLEIRLDDLGFLGLKQEPIVGVPTDVYVPLSCSVGGAPESSEQVSVVVRALRSFDHLVLRWKKYDADTGGFATVCEEPVVFRHPVNDSGDRPKIVGAVRVPIEPHCPTERAEGEAPVRAVAGLYHLSITGVQEDDAGEPVRRLNAAPAYFRVP